MPGYVQSQSASAPTSGNDPSVSLGAVTVGNIICFAASWAIPSSSADAVSASDSLGNSYQQVAATALDATNQVNFAAFWAYITKGGTPAVAIHFPATRSFKLLTAMEIAADQFDSGALNPTFQTDSASTDGMTSSTTVAHIGNVTVGMGLSEANPGPTYSAGTGYTARENLAVSSSGTILSETRIEASNRSIAATWTDSSGGFLTSCAVMTFRIVGLGSAAFAKFPKFPLASPPQARR